MLRLPPRALSLVLLLAVGLLLGCGRSEDAPVTAAGGAAALAPEADPDAAAVALLAAIQAWPDGVNSEPICYAQEVYPHWFVDTNADGRCDPAEVVEDNRYASWNATLLLAASRYEGSRRAPSDPPRDPAALARELKTAAELLTSCRPGAARPDCQAAVLQASVPAIGDLEQAAPAGKPIFVGEVHGGAQGCPTCHADQEGTPPVLAERCPACHGPLDDPAAYRGPLAGDFDGDGDATEPLHAELDGLADVTVRLLREAGITLRAPLCRAPEVYPYWFADLDGDGECSEAEASAVNPYKAWTGPMLRAAWALESYQRDPGAWAHDFRGMDARLVDAIAGLGGDTEALARP